LLFSLYKLPSPSAPPTLAASYGELLFPPLFFASCTQKILNPEKMPLNPSTSSSLPILVLPKLPSSFSYGFTPLPCFPFNICTSEAPKGQPLRE